MTTKNYDVPQREKGSELREVNFKFQEQGKRLAEVLGKITNIGNKLSDESARLAEKELDAEKMDRLPGLISDLYSTANGYQTIISKIEQQLSKLDGLI